MDPTNALKPVAPIAAKPASRVSPGQRSIEPLLERGDIRIGGMRPWDMRIHDDRVFEKVMAKGSIGLGEKAL